MHTSYSLFSKMTLYMHKRAYLMQFNYFIFAYKLYNVVLILSFVQLNDFMNIN